MPAKTKGDVDFCPYCGGEDLTGAWTKRRASTYLFYCDDCDVWFEVDHRYKPPVGAHAP